MAPPTRPPAGGRSESDGLHHLDRVRVYLGPACFPADREELLEHGVRHHAPPALLQLLVALPAHRSWPDLPAMLRELRLSDRERRTAQGMARECAGEAARPVSRGG